MIPSNELRFNNWIKYADKDYWIKDVIGKPCQIDIDIFIEAESKPDLYEPITLSPDVLEKVGFSRVDHIHGYSFYTLSKSKKNRCHIDIYPEKTQWMSYSVKHCKYLHELQNLYYSLTGSELEVVW